MMLTQDERPGLSSQAIWLFDVTLGIAALSVILGCGSVFFQFARWFLGTP